MTFFHCILKVSILKSLRTVKIKVHCQNNKLILINRLVLKLYRFSAVFESFAVKTKRSKVEAVKITTITSI